VEGGVLLGGFNGFSEYHTVLAGVSADESRFISSYPVGEGAIIDVGANLGLFSLLVATRLNERLVCAIEPNPSTFSSLSQNVERNGRMNIRCFQCAIAEHDGVVKFATSEHARANASIAGERSLALGTISVPCFTLDMFCKRDNIDQIALLKIDVEGHETSVLSGAARVLGSIRPAIVYFEVCPALTRLAGFDPVGPAAVLSDHGYKLNRFGLGGRLEPVAFQSAADVERVENWVAVLSS
jgi:FkbM family methyltransferase